LKILNTRSIRSNKKKHLGLVRYALGVESLPENMRILDWGGNVGYLLRDGMASNEIHPSNYTCVDVDQVVLELSRLEIPEANWIFRPVASTIYSSLEQDLEDIELIDNYYDFVFAYNVFNHTLNSRYLDDLDKLLAATKPGGKLLISFVSPLNAYFYLMPRRKEQYGCVECTTDDLKNIKDYMYFVNNGVLVKDLSELQKDNIKHFINIQNMRWLEKLYTFKSNISEFCYIDGMEYDNSNATVSSFLLTKGA